MVSRRAFLRFTGAVGTAAYAMKVSGLEEVLAATAQVAGRSAADVAQDEFYWREIQSGFTLDRTLINLNNGNSCPSPTVVHDALTPAAAAATRRRRGRRAPPPVPAVRPRPAPLRRSTARRSSSPGLRRG